MVKEEILRKTSFQTFFEGLVLLGVFCFILSLFYYKGLSFVPKPFKLSKVVVSGLGLSCLALIGVFAYSYKNLQKLLEFSEHKLNLKREEVNQLNLLLKNLKESTKSKEASLNEVENTLKVKENSLKTLEDALKVKEEKVVAKLKNNEYFKKNLLQIQDSVKKQIAQKKELREKFYETLKKEVLQLKDLRAKLKVERAFNLELSKTLSNSIIGRLLVTRSRRYAYYFFNLCLLGVSIFGVLFYIAVKEETTVLLLLKFLTGWILRKKENYLVHVNRTLQNQEQYSSLQVERNHLEEESKNLKQDLETSRATISTLQSETTDLKKVNTDLKQKVDSLTQNLKTTAEEIETFQQRASYLEQESEQLKSEKDAFLQNLGTTTEDLERYKQLSEDLKKTLSKKIESEQSLSLELEKSLNNLKDLESELKKVSLDLQMEKQSMNLLEKNKTEYLQQIQTLQTKLVTLEEKKSTRIEELIKTLAQTRVQKESLQQELNQQKQGMAMVKTLVSNQMERHRATSQPPLGEGQRGSTDLGEGSFSQTPELSQRIKKLREYSPETQSSGTIPVAKVIYTPSSSSTSFVQPQREPITLSKTAIPNRSTKVDQATILGSPGRVAGRSIYDPRLNKPPIMALASPVLLNRPLQGLPPARPLNSRVPSRDSTPRRVL